ncbi:MAG TPA: hypothetical protein VFJ74_02730, partial [Gemmatimonadaceae bacterium]|nr:hypothetical protein [Gemmatimonadaceae bacterium]
LRQLTDAVLGADAHLFKPADAIALAQGGDNGTPFQKDEAQAANPPSGAAIDYYLGRAARGPVLLEIADASGRVVQTYSSERAPANAAAATNATPAGRIPNTSPLWRVPAPEPLSTAAGLHRVVWTPVGPSRHVVDAMSGSEDEEEGPPLAGTFTARLTANGRTLTQTFAVRPDPRRAAR